MAITEAFRDAVKGGDVVSVRIMMKNSLRVDPTFAEFDEMIEVASGMDGLYDEHDGEELINDKSAWNNDYMNDLSARIVDNFSHERLNRLKEVARHLNPSKARPTSGGASSKPTMDRLQQIAAGAVVGAVVGGIVLRVAGAVVGAVVGGAVVGAAVGAVVIVAASANNDGKDKFNTK